MCSLSIGKQSASPVPPSSPPPLTTNRRISLWVTLLINVEFEGPSLRTFNSKLCYIHHFRPPPPSSRLETAKQYCNQLEDSRMDVWVRSGRVVRASGCQFRSPNSPGSIPASSDAVESEGQQMKQCC